MAINPNNAINHRAHRETYCGKRETLSFYDYLHALFYARLNLIIPKNITRKHRELLEIKSLLKVKKKLCELCGFIEDSRSKLRGISMQGTFIIIFALLTLQ